MFVLSGLQSARCQFVCGWVTFKLFISNCSTGECMPSADFPVLLKPGYIWMVPSSNSESDIGIPCETQHIKSSLNKPRLLLTFVVTK